MNRKDALIILGFIGIILASTVPFIYNSAISTGYVTFFEEIKFKLLVIMR